MASPIPQPLIPLLPITIFLGEKPSAMPSIVFYQALWKLFVHYIAHYPDCHAMLHMAVGSTTLFPQTITDHHPNTILYTYNRDPHYPFTLYTPIHTLILDTPESVYGFLTMFPDTKKEFFTPTSLLYKFIWIHSKQDFYFHLILL